MTSFVDRYDELAVIRYLLDQLRDFHSVQFPLREYVGIAGIGKTAFLNQVVSECNQRKLPCIFIQVKDISINTSSEWIPSLITKSVLGGLSNANDLSDNTILLGYINKLNSQEATILSEDDFAAIVAGFSNYYGVIALDSLNLLTPNELSILGEKIIFPLSETGHILILLGSRSRVDWGRPKYKLWRRTKSTLLLSFPLPYTAEQIEPYSELANDIQKITCGHPEANDIVVEILNKISSADVFGKDKIKDYEARLVESIIDDTITGKIIPTDLFQAFSILSVFRYLNFDLPSGVLEKIDKSRNWSSHIEIASLLRQMQQRTDFVISVGSNELGYKFDEFVRRALSLHLRMFSPEMFAFVNAQAKSYYEKKFYAKPSMVEFLIEKMFHLIDYLRIQYPDATDIDIARLLEIEFKKDIKPTIADRYYMIATDSVSMFGLEEPQERQMAVARLKELLINDQELNDKIGETNLDSSQPVRLLLRALEEIWSESRGGGLGVLEILQHYKPQHRVGTYDTESTEETDMYDVLFRTNKDPMGISQVFGISPQAKRGISNDIKLASSKDDLIQLGLGLQAQLPPIFHKLLVEHSEPLIIDVNDLDVPWELLYDGKSFLSLRIPLGKKVRTVEAPRVDSKNGSKVLLVGVPKNPKYEDLPILRFVEDELISLRAIFIKNEMECDVLFNEQADVWTVQKKMVSGDYKIIHFASHTLQSDDISLNGILLSDGILRKDVIKSSIRGNPLVVLNTCQSAIGQTEYIDSVYRGRFISGLATDFILGGAKACVANIWDVRDEKATDFVSKFYEELITNVMLGEAIRRAKYEEFNKDNTRTWASYVLFGNPSDQFAKTKG